MKSIFAPFALLSWLLAESAAAASAPEPSNDAAHLPVGGQVTIPVLANDSDPDGNEDIDWSSLTISTPPAKGTLSLDSAQGLITYTHTGATTGSDFFEYTIEDQEMLLGTATVVLTISNAPRLPLLTSQMPPDAPPQQYATPNAFPGVSFSQPLDMMTPPDENNRLFVIEKGGDIELIADLTNFTEPLITFLDLDSLVNARAGEIFQSGQEQGLLGLAFHPDYANNGRFFVSYCLKVDAVRYQRLSEFKVSPTDPNTADPNSEKVFIQQLNEAMNHNGGDLHFGPDGYLYMSWGDEGGGSDSLDNSQIITKDFWSSITRIDVDLEAEDGTPADGSGGDDENDRPNDHPAIVFDEAGNPRYEVPQDNPWVGASTFNEIAVNPDEVRTEFWAVGLRNPWRMSFDPATGDLWCGDVGQNSQEEVNLIVSGGNYEWVYREGFGKGPKWDERPTGWISREAPVSAYGRGLGRSITGGVVYRGSNYPELDGRYLFADYITGRLWALDNSSSSAVREQLTAEAGIAGFGYDPSNGDVLMADLNDGILRRLTTESIESDFPDTLSATGLFTSVDSLTPNPGLIPYDINLPFWSDHAFKTRWFGHPDTGPALGFSADAEWTQPAGFLWVKHFELELERGNPKSRKRIETRVLVKNEEGSYGVSYRWNESGTAATLADAAGEEFDLDITENDIDSIQRWRIPSRAECSTCHSSQAGHALSFNTRQLNRSGTIAGTSGNLLSLLQNSGYLTGLTEAPETLPRHVNLQEAEYSLEERARSWLAVNCAYCHNDAGTVPANWDTRASLALFETGLVDGEILGDMTDPADRLLVPGQEEHSAIIHRMAARNGYSRMPPLGSLETDDAAIQLLTDWIENELPTRQSYPDWRDLHFGGNPNGDPEIDFDQDGRTNHQEFLALTNPKQRDSSPSYSVNPEGEFFTLTLPDLPGRSMVLESSPNLADWAPWSASYNSGLSRFPGQPQQFQLLPDNSGQFFRIRIEER